MPRHWALASSSLRSITECVCVLSLCLYLHPCVCALTSYRGASPIPAPLLHGDRQTGVTICEVSPTRIDTGSVLLQVPVVRAAVAGVRTAAPKPSDGAFERPVLTHLRCCSRSLAPTPSGRFPRHWPRQVRQHEAVGTPLLLPHSLS